LLSNLEKAMTIQNRYSFNGSIEQLEELILKKNKNQTDIINKGSYKIHYAFSIGTLIIKNAPSVVDGINVNVLANFKNANSLDVCLFTKIRPEHYFIAIGFTFISLGTLFFSDIILPKLFSIPVWICFHLWFHWILRAQEDTLVNNLEKELNLIRV
jgi:hypothetical protein